jgi:hypothetical protein
VFAMILRMPINAAWHAEHPMPRDAGFEQRVEWHEAHARECGCRKPPPDIAARLEKRSRETRGEAAT